MLLTVLSLIHNALTLLFGVYVSAAFLGVKMNRKNVFVLLLFSIIVGGVYLGSYLWLGTSGTEKIYPFIIHLPLMLFLAFRFKYGVTLSSFAVLTAYLCCQISNWVGLAALSICNEQWLYYSVRIVITVATFILLICYVSDAMSVLMQKSTKALLILGIIPFVYYLFDYEDYKKNNGINIFIKKEMPGYVYEDFKELYNSLDKHEYNMKPLKDYKTKFLPKSLGNSSENITKEILNFLKAGE